MLARLEREWLSDSRPHLSGGAQPQGGGHEPEHRVADWAKPWGAAPSIKLDADIGRVDGALKGLGRWLPTRTVAKAEGRAQQRLDAITTELDELGPQAPEAAPGAHGAATKKRRFGRSMGTPVGVIAGLLLLAAGAGALLLGSHSGGGQWDSGDRRGAVAGERQPPGALDARIQTGSGQRTRSAGRTANPPGHPETQGSGRARSQEAEPSAPVTSEIAPPAPEPALVPQTAGTPQPAPPTPAPSSSASTTSTQSKSVGGGGCPPEFGYEC